MFFQQAEAGVQCIAQIQQLRQSSDRRQTGDRWTATHPDAAVDGDKTGVLLNELIHLTQLLRTCGGLR